MQFKNSQMRRSDGSDAPDGPHGLGAPDGPAIRRASPKLFYTCLTSWFLALQACRFFCAFLRFGL